MRCSTCGAVTIGDFAVCFFLSHQQSPKKQPKRVERERERESGLKHLSNLFFLDIMRVRTLALLHLVLWSVLVLSHGVTSTEPGGGDGDGDKDDLLCPDQTVACNVSLIINGNLSDHVGVNASTQVHSGSDCSEINCFCSIQYRIFPLEPYVSIVRSNETVVDMDDYSR